MGCLKIFTRAIILTLLILGTLAFTQQSLIKEKINDFLHPTKETVMENAKKVGDFSKIDKEFEVEKAVGVLGYNAVLAEHKSSGQKMVVVDSGKKVIITQEDIKAKDAEDRIKNAIAKIKYQNVALEEFHVIEKGTMNAYGQKNVPYVKFVAKIKKLPIGEISGVISVVKDKNGNDKILVSANSKEKYSQLISNEFFKSVK